MTTIISFIIVLGVLIFIHELGHFMVAKWSGVGVEKFSLGFGPKLIGVTRGETEYRLSILPLGGYVKMVGEAIDEDVPEEARTKSFTHKPIGYRAAIVAAGSIMNLILAFVLLPVIFMLGVSVPAYLDKPAVIGYVSADEAGARAGMLKGDVVESANDKKISSWDDLATAIALSPGKDMALKVRRGSEVVALKLTPEPSKAGVGIGGFLPPMEPLIGALSPGYPAAEAGIKIGDVITAIDGTAITHWAELERMVHESGDEKVFTIKRGGESIDFRIKPKYNEAIKAHLIGISRQEETILKRYGFAAAVAEGFSSAVDMTAKLFAILKGLVFGEYSLKTLGGPIMIAQVAGMAAEHGLTEVISLVAFLSLQLGIINLFPIPVLDGGHLVFLGIEYLRGRPLSERVISFAQQVGVVLLIALMAFVTWNDIYRIVG
jgi:regulator of sigma E protease